MVVEISYFAGSSCEFGYFHTKSLCTVMVITTSIKTHWAFLAGALIIDAKIILYWHGTSPPSLSQEEVITFVIRWSCHILSSIHLFTFIFLYWMYLSLGCSRTLAITSLPSPLEIFCTFCIIWLLWVLLLYPLRPI